MREYGWLFDEREQNRPSYRLRIERTVDRAELARFIFSRFSDPIGAILKLPPWVRKRIKSYFILELKRYLRQKLDLDRLTAGRAADPPSRIDSLLSHLRLPELFLKAPEIVESLPEMNHPPVAPSPIEISFGYSPDLFPSLLKGLSGIWGLDEHRTAKLVNVFHDLISPVKSCRVAIPLLNPNTDEAKIHIVEVTVRDSPEQRLILEPREIRAHGSFVNSLRLAFRLSTSLLGGCYEVRVNLTDLPTEIELMGESASLGVAIAICAAATDQRIGDLAVTGVIRGGRICGVKGIRAKVEAAIESGFKKMAIPSDNLPELEKAHCKGIDLVPLSSISDIFSILIDPWREYLTALSEAVEVEPSLRVALGEFKEIGVLMDRFGGERRRTAVKVAAVLSERRLNSPPDQPRPPLPLIVGGDDPRLMRELVSEVSRFASPPGEEMLSEEIRSGNVTFVIFHPQDRLDPRLYSELKRISPGSKRLLICSESGWERLKRRFAEAERITPDEFSTIRYLPGRSTFLDPHCDEVISRLIPSRIISRSGDPDSFFEREYIPLEVRDMEDRLVPMPLEEMVSAVGKVILTASAGGGKTVELLRLFVRSAQGELPFAPIYMEAEELIAPNGEIRGIDRALADKFGEKMIRDELPFTRDILLLIDGLDEAMARVGSPERIADALRPLRYPPYSSLRCVIALRSQGWSPYLTLIRGRIPEWTVCRLLPPDEGLRLPILLNFLLPSSEGPHRRAIVFRRFWEDLLARESRRFSKFYFARSPKGMAGFIRRFLEIISLRTVQEGRTGFDEDLEVEAMEDFIRDEVIPEGTFPIWWAHERVTGLEGEEMLKPVGRLLSGRVDRRSLRELYHLAKAIPLIVPEGEGLRFAHESLRDYWAAEGIARAWEEGRSIDRLFLSPHIWGESLIMAAGLIGSPDGYVRRLIEADEEGIWLAARALIESETISKELRGEVIRRLSRLFETADDEHRMEILELIGELPSEESFSFLLDNGERAINSSPPVRLKTFDMLYKTVLSITPTESDLRRMADLVVEWMRKVKGPTYVKQDRETEMETMAWRRLIERVRESAFREAIESQIHLLSESDDLDEIELSNYLCGLIGGEESNRKLMDRASDERLPAEMRWGCMARLARSFDERIISPIRSLLNELNERSMDVQLAGWYGAEGIDLIRRWTMVDTTLHLSFSEDGRELLRRSLPQMSERIIWELWEPLIVSGWCGGIWEELIGTAPDRSIGGLLIALAQMPFIPAFTDEMWSRIGERVKANPYLEPLWERIRRTGEIYGRTLPELDFKLTPEKGKRVKWTNIADINEVQEKLIGMCMIESGKRWNMELYELVSAVREAGDDPIRLIEGKLEEGNYVGEVNAVSMMGRLGVLTPDASRVAGILIDVASSSKDPYLRRCAVEEMVRYPEIRGEKLSIRMLEEALSGGVEERRAGAVVLTRIYQGEAIETVIEFLSDEEDPIVRRRVISGFRYCLDPSARDEVLRYLIRVFRGDPASTVRGEAVVCYARLAEGDELEALRGAFKDDGELLYGTVGELARKLYAHLTATPHIAEPCNKLHITTPG